MWALYRNDGDDVQAIIYDDFSVEPYTDGLPPKIGKPLRWKPAIPGERSRLVGTDSDEYQIALKQYLRDLGSGWQMVRFTDPEVAGGDTTEVLPGVVDIDREIEDADWPKSMNWDMPPYKSDEFMSLLAVGGATLEDFRKGVLYKAAVRGRLVVDDKWHGGAGYEPVPASSP